MSLFNILRFITSHPINRGREIKAVKRFVKWQLGARLIPYPVIYPFTQKSKLIVKKGMTGATGNLYCGLHEYNDMLFLLHFLRAGDLFADIGANIGSYTVLASAHVGAKTVAFEPVPSTYDCLLSNIYINRIHQLVRTFNVALGGEKGSILFTSTEDTTNHVATASDKNTIKVDVELLDNVFAGDTPVLMKIDVEGFETEVLKGATATLSSDSLKAIIIELNGSGSRYGYDEQWIHQQLLHYGFSPFHYDPLGRRLKPSPDGAQKM